MVACLLLSGCLAAPDAPLTISLYPASGYSPLEVRVEAHGADEHWEPLTYAWVFGDGTVASGPVADHVFEGKGAVGVRLTVTDAQGRQSTAEATVQLLNRLPHAAFTYQPYQPPTHQPVRFNAAGSYDPDGEIVSYAWDFGDGATAQGMAVEHAFETPGLSYRVVLTVTDDSGDANEMYRWVEPIGCDH